MALEYEAITEKIIGAAFEIHKELGYGFLEKVYPKAMQVEFKRLVYSKNPCLIRQSVAELKHSQ